MADGQGHLEPADVVRQGQHDLPVRLAQVRLAALLTVFDDHDDGKDLRYAFG